MFGASVYAEPGDVLDKSFSESAVGELNPVDEGAVVWFSEEGDQAVRALQWGDLIPSGWQPEQLSSEQDVSALTDEDPRAKALLDQLQALGREAPLVHELDGLRVKLAGFMVPLAIDIQGVREFLLVPYHGACIHVPPPPANQTVYVVMGEGDAYLGQLFDVVSVTGTLRVEHQSSELAQAGYRLEQVSVAAYQ